MCLGSPLRCWLMPGRASSLPCFFHACLFAAELPVGLGTLATAAATAGAGILPTASRQPMQPGFIEQLEVLARHAPEYYVKRYERRCNITVPIDSAAPCWTSANAGLGLDFAVRRQSENVASGILARRQNSVCVRPLRSNRSSCSKRCC